MGNPYRIIKYISEDDWLVKREKGITSTDVAAILGIKDNYIQTPFQVWQRKTSNEPPKKFMSSAASFGLRIEKTIAKQFADETGLKVRDSKALYQSTIHPCLLTSIDRFVWDEEGNKGILEIKTISRWVFKQWESGIPLKFFTQVNHQMYILGVPFVYFALWITESREIIKVRLERDDKYLEKQVKILVDFWENNVVKMMPPNYTSKDLETVQTIQGSTIQAQPTIVQTYDKLLKADGDNKKLEKDIEAYKQEIKDYMKESEILIDGDRVLSTWKAPKAGRSFDEDRFKRDQPDLYEAYLEETHPARRFAIIGLKEKKTK